MTTETTQTTTKFCSNCGEKIDVHAEICPHCGVRVTTPPSTKNPTTAVILSFFVIGLGQVYNGKYTKAIIMFVLAVVSAMLWSVGIGVITSLIIWIWSMSDAWNVAKGTGGSTSASVNTVVAVVGGFILLICISAVIGAFIFGMGGVDEDTATTSTSSPVKKPTPKATSYRVGDTISLSSHDITLLSADKKTYYLWSTSYGTGTQMPPHDQIFLKITIDVTNKKSSSVHVGYTDFNVEDSGGYRYDPYMEYEYQGSDAFDVIQEVGQGQKVKGSVMFLVPKNVEIIKVNYDCGSIFSQKIVSWEL